MKQQSRPCVQIGRISTAPERNLGNIAAMWSVYLECHLDAKDVAAMMALLKICRIATGKPKSDNWIDLAGYAAIGAEAEEGEQND